jgi:hypothetical protein
MLCGNGGEALDVEIEVRTAIFILLLAGTVQATETC